jgi:alkylation response protein AidB-like acyl-CoA dehydrogenase
MDFELTTVQASLLERVQAVLSSDEPPPRVSARALDKRLFSKLREGGFLDLVRTGGRSGVLDTSLVVEQVSAAAGIAPVAVHALVVPLLFDRDPLDIVAIQDIPGDGPFRYAGDASILIRFEGATAKAYRISPTLAPAVKTNYVYPLAKIGPVHGAAIASAPASAVRRRQRVGIAAECVGAMDATLKHLVSHLSQREQFGRKLGAFQAVQHRLSELSVLLESSRWFAREAAWLDEDETAALAAAFTAKAARRLCWEAHQLTGARGFTIDFGLYQHTLRLQTLSVEAGSIQAHADDAALLAWGAIDEGSQ